MAKITITTEQGTHSFNVDAELISVAIDDATVFLRQSDVYTPEKQEASVIFNQAGQNVGKQYNATTVVNGIVAGVIAGDVQYNGKSTSAAVSIGPNTKITGSIVSINTTVKDK